MTSIYNSKNNVVDSLQRLPIPRQMLWESKDTNISQKLYKRNKFKPKIMLLHASIVNSLVMMTVDTIIVLKNKNVVLWMNKENVRCALKTVIGSVM